jgi:DNA-binding HxlR family transcriptional regulator
VIVCQQAEDKSSLNRSRLSPTIANEDKAYPEVSEIGVQERLRVCPDFRNSRECSAKMAIDLIHGKWKTRILCRLKNGPVRLGELRRTFPQASKKMLAQNLREMERDGLVIRKDLSNRVLHVEYSLSDSKGLAVLQLISMLRNWTNEYLSVASGGSKNRCQQD